MYCAKCGAQMPDNVNHCPACGAEVSAPVQAAQPGPRPAQTTYGQSPAQPYGQGGSIGAPVPGGPLPGGFAAAEGQPAGQSAPVGQPVPVGQSMPVGQPVPAAGPPAAPGAPKKSVAPILIWVAAGLVLLLTIWLYFTYLFEGNPADSLRRAVAKTLTGIADEQAATADALGVGDALAALREGPAQMEIWGEMDVSQAARVSFDALMTVDTQQRRAEGSLELGGAGVSLVGMDFYLDGDLFSFSIPGMVAGTYGFHTTTLGEDLASSPIGGMLGAPIGPELSFDPFATLPQSSGADALETLGELTDTLLDASEVTRGSEEAAEVNGFEMTCQLYEVTIPEEALRDYLDTAAEGLLGEASGYAVELEPLLEDIEAAVEGEATCTAYVWDGYLVKAVFVLGDGSLTLDFGGEYISDAFAVTVVEAGRETFRFVTEGEKAPDYGYYSSYSILSVAGATGALEDVLSLEVYYDPAEELDNFGLVLELPGEGMYVDAFGTMSVDKASRSLTADLYDSWLEGPGSAGAFSVGFACAPAPDHTFTDVEPVMLFEMSEQELGILMMELLQGVAGTPGLGL